MRKEKKREEHGENKGSPLHLGEEVGWFLFHILFAISLSVTSFAFLPLHSSSVGLDCFFMNSWCLKGNTEFEPVSNPDFEGYLIHVQHGDVGGCNPMDGEAIEKYGMH